MTNLTLLLGIFGAILILYAWIIETVESIIKHKRLLDLKHVVIYFLGALFLASYAYLINEPIFFQLKLGIVIILAFEILYILHFKFEKRKK